MSDLSVKTTRGMLWSLAESLGLQAAQFVVSVVLARLLLPEQFGLIGMLSLFMAIAQSLLDSGFGSALVQRKDVTQVDLCSVFYFNLAIGVMITMALGATAPLIARFFSQPLLAPLTRLLSLVIVVNAFGLVPSTLLVKCMNFQALLRANLVAMIVSGGVAVFGAFQGWGVWSLAIQGVLSPLIRMLLVWHGSHWHPERVFSLDTLKSMFAFGSRMMLSGLLDTFFQNLYSLVIGRIYSAVNLGYYVRAQGMQSVAVQPTGWALGRVMFPAMSSIQDDRIRLKQAYHKAITTSAFFHFPLMIGLIVVASPLIRLLMTDRWALSVPYFQLLCVAGVLWPLHVLNLNVLQVTGRSDLFFRLEVAKKVFIVLSIVVTYRWGVVALLYGQIAVSLVGYYLNSFYSRQLINYPITEQIRNVCPYLFMSLGMGSAMYLVGKFVASDVARLFLQVGMGVIFYVTTSYVTRRPVLPEVLHLTRQAFGLHSEPRGS